MNLVECKLEMHGAAMLAIINEAIANTTWVYDYAPRTAEKLAAWVADRRSGEFPVVVAEDHGGELLGFGTFGRFRHLPGYKYTVEHTVFVEKSARRRGVGARLLQHLIQAAVNRDLHVLVGVIDSTNLPSIALHESLGFEACGTLREVGYKHGGWLDVMLYQYVLATPAEPAEN